MNEKDKVVTLDPLPQKHRRFVFIFMLVAFLLALPVFIFYALGYRYNFFEKYPVITATGGIYIASNNDDARVFLNEKEVKNARVFRKAFYIQGLEPGIHHLHVQEDGYYTWVKDLQIFSQIVAEVEVFNLPIISQIRPITEYSTKGVPAVFFFAEGDDTEEEIDNEEEIEKELIIEKGISETDIKNLFEKASSTVKYLVVDSLSVSTSSDEFKKLYKENSEYKIVSDLFLEKARLFEDKDDDEEEGKEEDVFDFVKTEEEKIEKNTKVEEENNLLNPSSTQIVSLVDEIIKKEVATTTKEKDNLVLLEKEGEVFVLAKGAGRQIPYYFCVAQVITKINKSPILLLEKENKKSDLIDNNLYTPISGSYSYNNGVYRTCRSSIKMDRQEKEVIDFDFYPDNSNLILMHLEDGIYVTEADDRSWQNSQLLYEGENLEMLVYRGSIFVKENNLIFEVITNLSK